MVYEDKLMDLSRPQNDKCTEDAPDQEAFGHILGASCEI